MKLFYLLFITLTAIIYANVLLGASPENYHVATNGDDSYPGTFSEPFKTLSKAATVAMAGDTVFIHEGVYEETLTPANSGTEGAPIVFQSFQNEKVIISAMQSLSGWQTDQGGVYKTVVDWTLGQDNFVMNESVSCDLARWPNNVDGDPFTQNSERNTGGSAPDVVTNAFLSSDNIPNYNWSDGGSVWFYCDKSGSGWLAWKAFIKSSTSGKITFDLDKNPTWIRTAHPPNGLGDFYLEGVKEALDYQNEWFFDEGSKTLYIQLPGGAAPEDGKIKMRKRKLAVEILNKNHIVLKNLAVFGGGIEVTGSNNLITGVSSFYGNITRGVVTTFRALSQSIYIKQGTGNRVEKCEIAYGSGSGVWDSGTGTSILNNYIHDFNYLGYYDAPVMLRGNTTTCKYNIIKSGGRDALQTVSKNSEIAYNDISYSNLIADDCGLLYTIGKGLNLKIHHNYFHESEGRGQLKKATGIYLDNDAEGVLVHHNVVWNTEWTNIQINLDGKDIDIFNNTLWNGSAVMGAWHKDGTSFTNVRVWNNLSDDPNWEPQADKKNNFYVSFDPFKNLTIEDFTLKPGSPLIDKGVVITGITDGYEGGAPDVGAFEYGTTPWKPGPDWDVNAGPNGNGTYGLANPKMIYPTDVSTFLNPPGFKLFPNPVATGEGFYVSFDEQISGDSYWQLITLNGTLLKSGKSKQAEFFIPVNGLAPGLYLFAVTTPSGVFSRKIVVR